MYIDSSVWNGAFDEHALQVRSETVAFFDRLSGTGEHEALVSDVVLQELGQAPAVRAAQLRELLRRVAPVRLDLDDESAALAEEDIQHGVVTAGHRADARHVAIATVGGADVLASWNYRHLVNRRRRDAFNGVNAILGYSTIEIISPPEVFDD